MHCPSFPHETRHSLSSAGNIIAQGSTFVIAQTREPTYDAQVLC